MLLFKLNIQILLIFFSNKSAIILKKKINTNKSIIDLKKDKYLFYKLIYGVKLIKFKIFKICIKTNLVNNFIFFFKFFINILSFLFKNQIKNFSYIFFNILIIIN